MSSPLRRGTYESWWTGDMGWFNAVSKVSGLSTERISAPHPSRDGWFPLSPGPERKYDPQVLASSTADAASRPSRHIASSMKKVIQLRMRTYQRYVFQPPTLKCAARQFADPLMRCSWTRTKRCTCTAPWRSCLSWTTSYTNHSGKDGSASICNARARRRPS